MWLAFREPIARRRKPDSICRDRSDWLSPPRIDPLLFILHVVSLLLLLLVCALHRAAATLSLEWCAFRRPTLLAKLFCFYLFGGSLAAVRETAARCAELPPGIGLRT